MVDEGAPLLAARGTTTPPKRDILWKLGALYGALTVCFGAFGTHGPKKAILDPAKIAILRLPSQSGSDRAAGTLFRAGTAGFGGSIYALVPRPARFHRLGPVTPLGRPVPDRGLDRARLESPREVLSFYWPWLRC
ncbi:hypothetical protein DL771_008015 [Monosporascus sp. 5C6A]|nr:hypothetical protein DL771_008015 [Monosporascus sp. 5C6A]